MRKLLRLYKQVSVCVVLTSAGLCFAPEEFQIAGFKVGLIAIHALPRLLIMTSFVYAILLFVRGLIVWSMPHSDIEG